MLRPWRKKGAPCGAPGMWRNGTNGSASRRTGEQADHRRTEHERQDDAEHDLDEQLDQGDEAGLAETQLVAIGPLQQQVGDRRVDQKEDDQRHQRGERAGAERHVQKPADDQGGYELDDDDGDRDRKSRHEAGSDASRQHEDAGTDGDADGDRDDDVKDGSHGFSPESVGRCCGVRILRGLPARPPCRVALGACGRATGSSVRYPGSPKQARRMVRPEASSTERFRPNSVRQRTPEPRAACGNSAKSPADHGVVHVRRTWHGLC